MGKVQVGQIIQDRYQVMKSLGRGGMAEVFLAEDTRLGRKVALKVIRMDEIPLSMHEEVHKRFEREPRALAQLQHPNIVSIHDYGFVGDEPFFIMDFVGGGSFDRLIKSRLNYREVARLLASVADALAYAHDRHILHRDVKPSNILLTEHRQPVLMDFGIAKVVSQDNVNTALTQAGMSVGTPAYMAPEQWRGEVYPQTDGYALGIVFYQMLTGEVPYTDDITMNIALKHMNEPIPQLCKSRRDIPSDVDLFLRKALAKDRNDRFVDMHQYRDALKVLSQGGSLQAFLGEESQTEIAVKTPPNVKVYSEAETEAPRNRPQVRPQVQPKPQPRPQPKPQQQVQSPRSDKPSHQPNPQAQQNFPDGYYRTAQPASPPVKKKKKFPLWGWVVIAVGVLAILAVIIIATVLGSMIGDRTPTAMSALEATQTQMAVDDQNDGNQNEPSAPTETQRPEEQDEGPEDTEPSKAPTYTPLPTHTPDSAFGAGDTIIWERDNAVMVFVPAGTFLQGSEIDVDPDTYTINEGPIHEVYLDAFWIDETEVINEAFEQFVSETGYITSAEQLGSSQLMNEDYNWDTVSGMDWRHPDGTSFSYDESKPVVHVSWIDASAYCRWAGKRLPTEAEWEKAARGPNANKYPWGNSEATSSLANYGNPVGSPASALSYPNGVSYYGTYNMAGNVWELVADYYGRDYYYESPSTNPQGPSSGEFYVAKGGSYGFDSTVIRSAVRVRRGPSQTFADMGFRCAANP